MQCFLISKPRGNGGNIFQQAYSENYHWNLGGEVIEGNVPTPFMILIKLVYKNSKSGHVRVHGAIYTTDRY